MLLSEGPLFCPLYYAAVCVIYSLVDGPLSVLIPTLFLT